MSDSFQAFVIALQPKLARRVRAFIAGSSAYADLSEFMAVAVENQLGLESGLGGRGPSLGVSRGGDDDAEPPAADSTVEALRLPEHQPSLNVSAAVQSPVYSLTNRLFPIKVAARVLANISSGGASLAEFHRSAAVAARSVGLRLRAEDAVEERKGLARRWIALPVGDDEPAALSRFANHFTIIVGGDGLPNGPLAQLGLASVDVDGAPLLTEIGSTLALCENPALDGGGGDLLSENERRIFISAIRRNAPELAAVKEFVAAVRDCGGRQPDVDARICQLHPSWSESQAVAQRAAMIGRLHDLGLATVEGRGPLAQIHLDEHNDEHWEE